MVRRRPALPWASFLSLAFLLWNPAQATPSVAMVYCSSLNTAETATNSSIFQSDGLCYNFCLAKKYALAIVQWEDCWCSNVVPGDTVSTDECNQSCPGYPSDLCGGDNLYGYMKANTAISPTSTESAASSESTSSSSSTGAAASTAESSASPTSGMSISTNVAIANPTSLTVQTVTVGGSVMTVTATTVSSTSAPNSIGVTPANNGLATGAIVGVVIGVLAFVGALLFILFLLWRRRRAAMRGDEGTMDGGSKRGSVVGIMGTPRTGEMGESRYVMGPDGRTMADNWENPQSVTRRSTLMPVDPRLDPYAKGIYLRNENRSHESVASLQDDHDYSRPVYEPKKVLRATNPDPTDP